MFVSTLCLFNRHWVPAVCDLLQCRDGWHSASIQRSRGKFRQRKRLVKNKPAHRHIEAMIMRERNSKGCRDTQKGRANVYGNIRKASRRMWHLKEASWDEWFICCLNELALGPSFRWPTWADCALEQLQEKCLMYVFSLVVAIHLSLKKLEVMIKFW